MDIRAGLHQYRERSHFTEQRTFPTPQWATVAERRTLGYIGILGSLLCCVPLVQVSAAVVRDWDRLSQSNTPLWILPLLLLCYAAAPVAMLCVGRGLLSGRAGIAKVGGALLVAAVMTGITLFAVFD